MIYVKDVADIKWSVLRFVNQNTSDFKENLIDYIKSNFNEQLSDADIDLLDTEDGLSILQDKISSQIKTYDALKSGK